jgi:hypothetical protein
LRRQAGVIHEDYGEESFAKERTPWDERQEDEAESGYEQQLLHGKQLDGLRDYYR